VTIQARLAAVSAALFGLLACPNHATASLSFSPISHEAIYQLDLEQNRPSSGIISANGKLSFMLQDDCAGWTSDQKLDLTLLYSGGEKSQLKANNSSWESTDGKEYRFASRTLTNDQESENYHGSAQLDAKGAGYADYVRPQPEKIKIPADTMLPMRHTQEIVKAARKGVQIPSQRVFDGNADTGMSDVTVFISRAVPLAAAADLTPELRKNSLLSEAAWPVQMAFYAFGEKTGKNGRKAIAEDEHETENSDDLPDYELRLDLLPNGVARQVMLDYGSFSMRGKLMELKPLPVAACASD
jgi:hypothetical protein